MSSEPIDDPSWGDDRNNPGAEANIAKLLALWRAREWSIVHVRHSSREPKSTYRKGQTGFEFKDEVLPRDGERVVEKQVNSAFIGTGLQEQLEHHRGQIYLSRDARRAYAAAVWLTEEQVRIGSCEQVASVKSKDRPESSRVILVA
jgi:nicotinamidase-related amidase